MVVKIQNSFDEFNVLQIKIANLTNDSRDRCTRISYRPKHTGRFLKCF